MEPERRKSCDLYLAKKGDWLTRNRYCLYISIDKFWCDAERVKRQLLAAGRSTIRFSTKVTCNSLSHLVFKGKKVAVHQVLLCILPLSSTPHLTLHTHRTTKRTVMVNLGTKDQTHLFRNPLIFSRTKPESAEGPSSPGVQ